FSRRDSGRQFDALSSIRCGFWTVETAAGSGPDCPAASCAASAARARGATPSGRSRTKKTGLAQLLKSRRTGASVSEPAVSATVPGREREDASGQKRQVEERAPGGSVQPDGHRTPVMFEVVDAHVRLGGVRVHDDDLAGPAAAAYEVRQQDRVRAPHPRGDHGKRPGRDGVYQRL